MKQLAILFSIITFSVVNAQKKLDTSMYPEAKEGYEKVELILPEKANENDFKVEIKVGKYEIVDGCNHFFVMGDFKEHDVKGWGYSYFEFISDGNIAGTLMGCPDNKSIKKFISGQPEIVRYNSRLPIVVYVPKGMSLQYRFWSAENDGWNDVK